MAEEKLSREEMLEEIEMSELADREDLLNDRFPHLYNLSSAFIYRFMPRPLSELPPEFIHIKLAKCSKREISKLLSITEWNLAWEAGHLRHEFFGKKIYRKIRWLKDYKGHNVYLLPQYYSHRYHAYASLFHLINYRKLDHFGLPLLKEKGIWPQSFYWNANDLLIPHDFDLRLGKAFASHIWPFIDSGSPITAFSSSDPLKLLAHNLDFWLPYIFKVVEKRLQGFERLEPDDKKQIKLLNNIRKKLPFYIEVNRPLKGGTIWEGEREAWEATREMVDYADSDGKLRAIIDAIRSNRVKEDFSSRWSYAKEDFERKLYSKRSKIKVSFVELNDTIPVHGPESEVHENIFWEDFLALLDQKERHIVVCLRNGITRLGDISKLLGYANHSPVSKALARIRRKAKKFLDS